jgi:hypothetical protein
VGRLYLQRGIGGRQNGPDLEAAVFFVENVHKTAGNGKRGGRRRSYRIAAANAVNYILRESPLPGLRTCGA